jgi:outer membrane protein assembly factor BamB
LKKLLGKPFLSEGKRIVVIMVSSANPRRDARDEQSFSAQESTMHITVYCPSCHSRYQLDPGLRGQRMRCPNPVCREIFEVQDAAPEEAPSTEAHTGPAAIPVESGPSDGAGRPDRGASPKETIRTTGSVGDLVPILDAEVVHEVPPPGPSSESPPKALPVSVSPDQDPDDKPIPVDESLRPPPIEVYNLTPLDPGEEEIAKPIQEAPSWQVPPPVRNPNAPKAPSTPSEAAARPATHFAPAPAQPTVRKPKSAPKTLPAVPAKPSEEAAPSWQSTPPVRRPPTQVFPEPEPADLTPPMENLESPTFSPQPVADTRSAPSRAGRRALWIIGGMVVIAGFIVATATVLTLNTYVQTEEKRYAQAKHDYEEGKYASAANAYQSLLENFPNNENQPFYRLLGDLSRVRDQIYSSQADPDKAAAAVHEFLEAHKSDPNLKPYRNDIGQTLGKLAEQLTTSALERHDLALLTKARETLDQSERYQPSDPAANRAAREKIAQVQSAIILWGKKQDLLARLNQWLQDQPSLKIVTDARLRAKQEGLDQDADIKDGITKLESVTLAQVRYVAHEPKLARGAAETIETSLLVVPPVVSAPPSVSEGKRAVLALARGVLYALDQNTGEERWATRVGIDTETLPVRLPATPTSSELFLVLSADRNTDRGKIMALAALDGSVLWQHQLSAPCLGKPVIVPGAVGWRVFVPTYDGFIYEIETSLGHLLGHFDLRGQHLTVGGVWQQGTDRLYFPGDSDYVYVLDAAVTKPNAPPEAKHCVAILHTGHPSGSLRGEPILVNRVDPFAKSGDAATSIPSYLILAQEDGLDHMKLRVFALPIESPDAPPLLEPRIRGWSWLQPYHDGEKLAFATDAGIFELFGINQVRNEDPPLFRQLPDKPNERKRDRTTTRLGRAQVVHVAENDFWVLENGELQRLHFDLFGSQMVPVWSSSRRLGSPAHAAQLDESEKTIFVVTQDLTRQIYLATAVAAEDGTIKWQRQLGLECQSDPLVLDGQVITIDRGGGLFVFDGSKYRHQERREWRNTDPEYAPALQEGPVIAHLLPGPDGRSAYAISCPASGGKLTVRRYHAGGASGKPTLTETSVEDPNLRPLAGTPALVGQSVLLPLADGTIRRFTLPLKEAALAEGGPNWRGERVDEGARGHIVALGAEDFLTTDGSRGLTRWHWPQNDLMNFRKVPINGLSVVELPARIVAPPLAIPPTTANGDWQVCVADSAGTLTLLRLGQDAKQEESRTWSLGGKITAGPFRRGAQIGCIVERRHLFWIDPSRAKPLWDYRTEGEGIVGEPQLVGGLLVVADSSGRFMGLDPASGKSQGGGYSLKANAAPAAAPVAYGADVAFVPLTDGTVFLLGLRHLRDPLVALPALGP